MTQLATTSTELQPRVLIVDDEAHVRSALVRSLVLRGYCADEAASGHEALEMLESTAYDAMVLDIRMPDMSGVAVMQQAYQIWPDLSIIILTGYATLETAIAAVKAGAVDYLLKPSSVHDIAAAVANALQQRTTELRRRHLLHLMGRAMDEIRRIEVAEEKPLTPPLGPFLRAGPVMLDQEMRVAVVAGGDSACDSKAKLTSSETALLAYLMQHPGVVLSCRELARAALGYDVNETSAQNIVRPHICRLRKKIEPDPVHPRLIRTISGAGYLFVR